MLLRSRGGRIPHTTNQVQHYGLARGAASKGLRGGKEMMLYWVTSLGSACVPSCLRQCSVETVASAPF